MILISDLDQIFSDLEQLCPVIEHGYIHQKLSSPGSILPGNLENGVLEHSTAMDLFSSSCGANQKSTDERLLDLTNASGMSIVQRNGQRIYGGPPPDWKGPAPEKGCEIFCGKVPRDCFEDELVPIFTKVGRGRGVRLIQV